MQNRPTVIGRSNAVDESVRTVRQLGFGNDQLVEMQATTAGDVAAYEYAHVIVGLKKVPRAFTTSALVRVHAAGEWSWVGGTLAAFARVIDTAEFPKEARLTVVSALAHAYPVQLFGNPRFLPAPGNDIIVPLPREFTAPMQRASGGIIAAVVDATSEAELVAAGARVLERATDDAVPRWSARHGTKSAKATARPLSLPVAIDALSDADQKIMKAFLSAYAKVQAECTNTLLRDALRLPLEAQEVLFVIDHATLDQVSASGTPAAARIANEMQAAFAGAHESEATMTPAGAAA
jgi:hypothetical protein